MKFGNLVHGAYMVICKLRHKFCMNYMHVCLPSCGGRKILKSQESGPVPGSNVTPHSTSISPA
jgi:hypothetical protein